MSNLTRYDLVPELVHEGDGEVWSRIERFEASDGDWVTVESAFEIIKELEQSIKNLESEISKRNQEIVQLKQAEVLRKRNESAASKHWP
jgi:hypothetical protein